MKYEITYRDDVADEVIEGIDGLELVIQDGCAVFLTSVYQGPSPTAVPVPTLTTYRVIPIDRVAGILGIREVVETMPDPEPEPEVEPEPEPEPIPGDVVEP